mgnify:CR=1 FL=1
MTRVTKVFVAASIGIARTEHGATADELVVRSGLSVTEVYEALLSLELDGVVERLPSGAYQYRRATVPGE